MPDDIHLEGEVEINDDADLDTPGPTSDVNLNPDKDEEIDEEKPTHSSKAKDVDWETDENPYKKRYGDSTREAQQLLAKIKEHEGLTAQERARAERLEKEREDVLEKLKAEKPEAYDNHALQSSLAQNTKELAELKEKVIIDGFISENPIAKDYREALKAHARAFPQKSLEDIWSESFKDVAESKVKLAEAETTRKKKTQTDTGKGTSTADPGQEKIGGYTVEEFDKLPVAKRREILIKQGSI